MAVRGIKFSARRRTRGAFAIADLLVSVALLAILLAAVAVAVHASTSEHRENDKIASATQAARMVLDRVTRDVRTSAAVDPDAGADRIRLIPPDDGSGITRIEYETDGAGALYRKTTRAAGTTTETMLGGTGDPISVSAFHVTHEVGTDWQGLACTTSLTLRLEFEVAHQRLAVTASVAPRRSQRY